MGIHGSSTNGSVLDTNAHDIANLLGGLSSVVGEIFDVDTGIGFFVELETVLRILG